jgi:hypothetical protein
MAHPTGKVCLDDQNANLMVAIGQFCEEKYSECKEKLNY